VSDEVVERHFVCDLVRCKGGCCVEGDAGAPLTEEEKQEVMNAYAVVKDRLTEEGRQAVAEQGYFVHHPEFGWVTPTIANGMCAYGMVDEQGIVKCSFEQAYNQGETDWKKPLSCHLFPIKVSRSRDGQRQYVNYEPRPTLCRPACALGEKLQIPVYEFLKEPLQRAFGSEFYEVLSQIAEQYYSKHAK
jgi:hypothetical protein